MRHNQSTQKLKDYGHPGKQINQHNEGTEIKLHSGEDLRAETITPHIESIFSNNGEVR